MRFFYTIALVTICLVIYSPVANATLQNEMDELFGTMSNVTRPGVYETQTRGVLAGGGLTVKARIYDANLVAVTPPSIEAGCGGIDLYGGSFSFINKEQFVQLMRSVAANAQGYAFKLAFDAICPNCNAIMETLARKINSMNKYFGNSCQMAKGLVTNTFKAAKGEQTVSESLLAMTGGAGDLFESWSKTDNTNSSEKAETTASGRTDKEIKGNITWRQLIKNNVPNWFGNNNTEFAEAIMTFTGSLIVGDLVPDEQGLGQTRVTKLLPGNKIGVRDLLTGGTFKIYDCDTTNEDGCLMANAQNGLAFTMRDADIKGMEVLVREMFLGSDTSPGIIYKAVRNVDGSSISEAEKAFLANLRGSMGTMVMQLAKYGDGGASTFAHEAAPFIALDLIENLTVSMFETAIMSQGIEYTAMAKENVRHVREAYQLARDEIASLRENFGGYDKMLAKYKLLLEIVQKKPIGIRGMNSDVAGKRG